MKRSSIWRLIFIGIIVSAIAITNLSNGQKASIYQFFGRTFSETISHKNVALPILSIEKTTLSHNENYSTYLVEYEPQKYVLMQASDDNETFQHVLNGNMTQIAVKVISRYRNGTYQVQRQFDFSEKDFKSLHETTRQNLLHSRIVSLTHYDGMNFMWVAFVGIGILAFNIILTFSLLLKRRKAA